MGKHAWLAPTEDEDLTPHFEILLKITAMKITGVLKTLFTLKTQ